eukprot:CAMPEP_0184857990 /NCGR_PEP_ID=MMETSP0580-20130426/3132_1 /TAXON_ID=1118495 /ORGANISM="Dactyliosolen fragilissimus" /LENGTH=367 /DNA_ID=CAMNT_0027353901 /DNA_START=209 /DNA_END=1312 /DNA_ORIENTATION=+
MYKRSKLSSTSSSNEIPPSSKTIATHSGTFQADEALGVWLLRQTSTYRNSPVIRTRDPAIYSKADIVIDVGGIYDHERRLYDHHQRDYNERFEAKLKRLPDGSTEESERCTKLSASGLVYRHYGREVIHNFYPELQESHLDWTYTKMYDRFMESVDAVDTGVEPFPEGFKPLYSDSTGLSIRVSRLNPRWNEECTDEDENGPDDRFEIASGLCGQEFLDILTGVVESDIPAKTFVETAVKQRFDVDSSGKIICFPSGGLPWKGHLYNMEKDMGLSDDNDDAQNQLIKFVLYTDQGGMWRVQAVPIEGRKFDNRLGLPEPWRGVRDEDLEKISGIKGAKFCHAAGFIGGAQTYEGALEMARAALKTDS